MRPTDAFIFLPTIGLFSVSFFIFQGDSPWQFSSKNFFDYFFCIGFLLPFLIMFFTVKNVVRNGSFDAIVFWVFFAVLLDFPLVWLLNLDLRSEGTNFAFGFYWLYLWGIIIFSIISAALTNNFPYEREIS
jgi:hypothetical protein